MGVRGAAKGSTDFLVRGGNYQKGGANSISVGRNCVTRLFTFF